MMDLMGDEAAGVEQGRPEPMSRRATTLWRVIEIGFVVVTAAAWVTAAWLPRLPVTDDSGRSVMFVVGNQPSDLWLGASIVLAAAMSPVTAAGLLVWIVRRVPRRWRVLAKVVAWTVWLLGTVPLTVMAVVGVLLIGIAEEQMIVRGDDGSRVMIVWGFDGDVAGVWRQATSFTYLRDPGETTIDPSSGPCHLDRAMASQLTLTCGSTSQLVSDLPGV